MWSLRGPYVVHTWSMTCPYIPFLVCLVPTSPHLLPTRSLPDPFCVPIAGLLRPFMVLVCLVHILSLSGPYMVPVQYTYSLNVLPKWFLSGLPCPYMVPRWSQCCLRVVPTCSPRRHYIVCLLIWSLTIPDTYLAFTWSYSDPYLVPKWSLSDPFLVPTWSVWS
jgi:hypothetical protein